MSEGKDKPTNPRDGEASHEGSPSLPQRLGKQATRRMWLPGRRPGEQPETAPPPIVAERLRALGEAARIQGVPRLEVRERRVREKDSDIGVPATEVSERWQRSRREFEEEMEETAYAKAFQETRGDYPIRRGIPFGTAIPLGKLYGSHDQPYADFSLTAGDLNRHTFVAGATGSGKSQTVREILTVTGRQGLKFMAIEPAKSEYAAMSGRLGEPVIVMNPADPDKAPISIDPFAPEPGFPLRQHIDLITTLLVATLEAEQPFPQILDRGIQSFYTSFGWDPDAKDGRNSLWKAPPRTPPVGALRDIVLAAVREVGYAGEVESNMEAFTDMRAGRMGKGTLSNVMGKGHPVSMGYLMNHNVVLELEGLGSPEYQALAMGGMLIKIIEYLRLEKQRDRMMGIEPSLKHLLVIEEAHRLLRAGKEDGASAQAMELFGNILAEIRAFGEGLIIAEQSPTSIAPEVMKNTNTKIFHRMGDNDDREKAGGSIGADEETQRRFTQLTSGRGTIMAPSLKAPTEIQINYGEANEKAMEQPEIEFSGRRSPACGDICGGSACAGEQIHQAEVQAGAEGKPQAWLRIWADTVALAALGREKIPDAPKAVKELWENTDPRLRECTLATAVEAAVEERAGHARRYIDPSMLAASASAVMRAHLDEGLQAEYFDPKFMLPQFKVIHELKRLDDAKLKNDDPAPKLNYDVPGVPNEHHEDGSRVTTAQRKEALLHSEFSMHDAENREVLLKSAWGYDRAQDMYAAPVAKDMARVSGGLAVRGQVRLLENAMNLKEHFLSPGWLGEIDALMQKYVIPHTVERKAAGEFTGRTPALPYEQQNRVRRSQHNSLQDPGSRAGLGVPRPTPGQIQQSPPRKADNNIAIPQTPEVIGNEVLSARERARRQQEARQRLLAQQQKDER